MFEKNFLCQLSDIRNITYVYTKIIFRYRRIQTNKHHGERIIIDDESTKTKDEDDDESDDAGDGDGCKNRFYKKKVYTT